MTGLATTFWEMLDPTEHALLRQSGTVRRFASDVMLCSQGETLRHIFVLLKGQVKVEGDARDGRHTLVAVRGPGDIIGELASIDSQPRSADVRALNAVDALVISAQRFDLLLQTRPKLTWAVLQVVSGRLREANRQRIDHVGGAVAARIAVVLLENARQRGITTSKGVQIKAISQQDLGSMIGVSRASVARVLRDLRSRNLVITGREHITIPRIDLLQQWLDTLE